MLGSTENGARQSPSCCVVTTRGGGRGLSRPDLEITVCGVSEWERNVSSVSAAAAAFHSLDWLLAAVEAAHYRDGGILPYVLRQLLRADEPHKEPHKKVM